MERDGGTVHGSKVAIVGGSIAGCAIALALTKLGCTDVTIFERSAATTEFGERGKEGGNLLAAVCGVVAPIVSGPTY